MIKVSSELDRVLVAKIHEAGQEQLFDFWLQLSGDQQSELLHQIHSFDLPLVLRLAAQVLQKPRTDAALLAPPPEVLRLPKPEDEARDQALSRDAFSAGDALLHEGKVAVLTAAGGVRRARGFDRPEATLPIGPVSGKSTFQLHAEKIRALARRCRTAPTWIVATSPSSHAETLDHFHRSGNFGLSRSDVHFLVQDELPAINRRGKLMLAAPDRLAVSPSGHGGVILKLLASDELFDLLELRRVEHLFYFQADNPLVRIADPRFLGHHVLRGAEMSSKAVRKLSAEEEVGTFCMFNGALGVVEHYEINAQDRAALDERGELRLAWANIAVHVFALEFLRRLRNPGFELPYHLVECATPTVDRHGKRTVPRKPNSIHCESLIFDLLPLARTALVVEAERAEEFSPVRNSGGASSVATARQDLARLAARWLRQAGANTSQVETDPPTPIEISPLFALDAAELREKIPPDLAVTPGLYLEPPHA